MGYAQIAEQLHHGGSALRPIHYLGSKLRAVPQILETVESLRRPGTAVCDLFAGSGTVANALGQYGPIVAGDIQEYSRVICSALLTPPKGDPSRTSAELLLNRPLRQQLMAACAPLLEYENLALAALRSGDTTPIAALQHVAPLELTELPTNRPELGAALALTKARLREGGFHEGAETVVLRHFAGSYFSVQQAIDLCALLEAARGTGPNRDQQIAAALSVASDIVNSVGKQFAQPLKLSNSDGTPKAHLAGKIQRDKHANVLDLYDTWIMRYRNRQDPKFSHQVLRSDYTTTLIEHCGGVSVIYADPPYGREHYSRYYHVLETMSLGDAPTISRETSKRSAQWSTGAYRSDRHQSPFCIRTRAPAAFQSLFSQAKLLGASLVLSYSPTRGGEKPRHRVVDLEDLVNLAAKFFTRVENVAVSTIEHNKLNRSDLNSDTPSGSEVLIVCS